MGIIVLIATGFTYFQVYLDNQAYYGAPLAATLSMPFLIILSISAAVLAFWKPGMFSETFIAFLLAADVFVLLILGGSHIG